MDAVHSGGLGGKYGNVIRRLAPLVIPENVPHEGLDVLDEAIGSATA